MAAGAGARARVPTAMGRCESRRTGIRGCTAETAVDENENAEIESEAGDSQISLRYVQPSPLTSWTPPFPLLVKFTPRAVRILQILHGFGRPRFDTF